MNSDTAMTQKKGEHLTNGSIFNEKRFISDLYVCETIKEILMDRIKKLKSDLYWLGTDKKDLNIPSFEQSKFRQEFNREGQLSQKYPKKPIKPHEYKIKIDIGDTLSNFCFSAFIATVIYLILGFLIIGFFYDDHPIIFYLISFTPFIIGAIIYTYWVCFSDKVKERSDYKNNIIKYKEDLQRYEMDCEKIDKNNAIIKKRNTELWNQKKQRYNEWVEKEKAKYQAYCEEYERNRTIKEYLLKQELDAAQHELSKVNKTLISLYTLKINGVYCIHPNYQGLISVSVIYGYFDTGRCSTLRGHEGAYNLYEDEKIKGIIIDQLGEISCELKQLNASMSYVGYLLDNCERQLETLNENMETLISETSRMNANINESFFDLNSNISGHFQGIENRAEQIEANTANSAYYSEVGAKMSTLNTFYNIGKDL